VTASFAGQRLSGPRGVLLDPTGTWLYIGDTRNARVVRIRVGANGISFSDPQVVSTGADTPEGNFKGPEWMEFGPDGRLFVSDNNQRIYAFEING
jgi:sugar lactone lactonase YvrE